MKKNTNMKTNLTFDITKVRWATFYYCNQEGVKRIFKPDLTVNGIHFNPNEYSYPLDRNFPNETLLERARRLDLLDRWTPTIVFTFTKYDTISIKGKRAVKLKQVWDAYIFRKNKNKNKNK